MKAADFLDSRKRAHKALELTMRDVLEGLEQMALVEGYGDYGDCFEILSIEPATPDTRAGYRDAS